MANYHLVILKKPYIDAILAGRKTIESRFYRGMCSPIGRVEPGDRLFLKISAGPVVAAATVASVRFFQNLTPDKIAQIKQQYNSHILGTEQYWQDRADCKFALLLWLDRVRPIKPVRIAKRDWRSWVVLTARNNFGLLDTTGVRT